MTRGRAALIAALVALLLHLPILGNGLVWDDAEKFGTARWDGMGDLVAAVTPDYWSELSHEPAVAGYYRPVASLLFAWNQACCGLQPRLYHAESLVLHAGVAALVVLLAAGVLGLSPLGALAAGLLFAVHPIHTEAVAFASDLTDLLAAAAYLAGLLLLLRRGRRWRGAVGAALLWLIALGSKEMAITLPLLGAVLVGLGLNDGERGVNGGAAAEEGGAAGPAGSDGGWRAVAEFWRSWLLLGLAGGGYLVVRLRVFGDLAAAGAGLQWNGVALRASEVGRSLAMALRMSFWPWPLVADYGPAGKPAPPAVAPILLAAVVLLGLVTIPWWRRGCGRGVAFGYAWMVLTFLPVMNLIPIPQPRAERFLYLPSVGLVIGAAWCLERLRAWLRRRRRGGRWGWALPLFLILPLGGALSWQRLPQWRDEVSLWESVLRVLPENPRALQNLGAAYAAAGDWERALPLYARAYSLAPRMEKVVIAYANALHRRGRHAEALEVLRESVRQGANGVEVVGMLAASLARQGEYEEAAELFGRIVAARPGDGRARVSRALCWVALGRLDDARRELRMLEKEGGDGEIAAPLRSALAAAGGE